MIIKLDYVPEGPVEIEEYYGKPGEFVDGIFVPSREFVRRNITWFKLDFPLRQSWDQKVIWGFYAHRKVGRAMVDALEQIHRFYKQVYMRLWSLDQWGGIHNPRMKAGDSSQLSTHAWAIAIDYCPELGPLGKPPRTPQVIVEAFTSRYFRWGGYWARADGMHFQACRGY